jgi:hypothetical protein
MPVFTALMSGAFGSEDPFGVLAGNDLNTEEENVRILPAWVADELTAELRTRQVTR